MTVKVSILGFLAHLIRRHPAALIHHLPPKRYRVCDADSELQEWSERFAYPNPLIFHHPANTGGSSFLRALYRSASIDPRYYDAYVVSVAERERAAEAVEVVKVRMLSAKRKVFVPGHWVSGLDQLVGAKCCCFTILRNPIERFISEFFWQLRRDPVAEESPWRRSEDLVRWVDAFSEAGHANFYCSEFATPSLKQPRFVPHLVPENMANTSPADLFTRAQERLESAYFFVAIMELFEESLFYLARMMGCPTLVLWRVGPHVAGRGASPRKYSADMMPVRARRRLTSLLEADIELYNIYRERFEDACARDPPGGDFEQYKRDASTR